jgi:lipoprotein NlpI
LQGKLAENDLIASASATDPVRNQEQLCECWYYAGMKRLLAGDKSTAKDDFNKCVATKRVTFAEYELAKAELASL